MPLTSRFLAAALFLAPLPSPAQDSDCPPEQQVKLTIQSAPFPSLPGQSVQFNIFAEPANNTFDPTGTVSLSDDVTDLGSAPLALSQTSLTRTFYTAGAHIIRVVYSGDNYYCAAVSTFGQAVDRITPTISIASSATTSPFGALVTFTAQVGPAAPTGVSGPAGPVQFFDSGTLIGAADLVSGKAVFTTAALAAGTHQISAILIGDPNWYSVRTAPLPQTVTAGPTNTLLNATATASDVAFTVSVNAAGVIPQTGTLQILDTATNTTLATLTLPATTVTLPIAKVPVGHPIAAFYTEGVRFASSTSNMLSLAAFANAAGSVPPGIAPDEIVSLFGSAFATTTLQASGGQLAATLGGVSVNITDKSGTARPAGLYLVSPTQINLLVPTAVVPGLAMLTVSGTGTNVIPMQVTVAAVAPGLFNPGPQILRVAPDGTQTVEVVTTAPIVIGPDPTYLILYATGLRNRSSLAAVSATVGNVTLPVIYAGGQSQFPGLDQVDVLLPQSLKSTGKVNVSLMVDSQPTNAIPLQFQ
jgi:uncharacterized protein (TIGR03437 family)